MSDDTPNAVPDVFRRIQDLYPSLSKQQAVIADAILEQGLEVAFLSCNQLANASGASPATVVRFIRSVGYAKYVDFIDELNGMLLEGRRPMSKLTQSLSANEGAGPTVENTRAFDIQSILDLADFEQEASMAAALKLLVDAKRILVTGARSAYSLAYYAGFLLREMAHNVEYFPSGAEDAFERLENAGSEDVMLVVAFHRYARSSYRLARFAAERKVRVISMTDALDSPMRSVADVALYGPSSAPFYSYVAPMTVLNALVWGYARAKRAEVSEILDQRQRVLIAEKIFL